MGPGGSGPEDSRCPYEVPRVPPDLCVHHCPEHFHSSSAGGEASALRHTASNWGPLGRSYPCFLDREAPCAECGLWNQASPSLCLHVLICRMTHGVAVRIQKCHLCSTWTRGLCMTHPRIAQSSPSPSFCHFCAWRGAGPRLGCLRDCRPPAWAFLPAVHGLESQGVGVVGPSDHLG